MAYQVVSVVRNTPASAADIRNEGLIPWLGRCPGEGNGNHSSILARESHGQRGLAGYSP